MTLPLIDYPDFRFRRNNAPKKYTGIILHWTAGTNRAPRAIEYTGRLGSGGWYHHIMDLSGIHQAIDPAKGRAGHAGSSWNSSTIGIAISQTVYPGFSGAQNVSKYMTALEKNRKDLLEQSYDVEIVDYHNPYPKVLSLDKTLAGEVAAHVSSLCDQFEITKAFHTGLKKATVKPGKLNGVCCHHHVSSTKWDCIPWMNELTIAFDRAGFTLLP